MKTCILLPQSVRSQRTLVACLASLLLPAVGVSQTAVREERTVPVTTDVRVVDPAHPLKHSDREFVEKAAKSSMSEVLISRVAVERTTNPEVKRFAQTMIDDHTSASEQLATLASNRGLALPAKDPNPDRWEKRDAKNFDKEYIEKMVSDHEDAVKLFEKQANKGEDADTVAFARKHLPKLQKHLQAALDLKRMLNEKR
jgi:putative membrane protein